MRVSGNLLPQAGAATHLELPDVVTHVLDEGWQVVNHTISAPDLSGDMLLSLYCER